MDGAQTVLLLDYIIPLVTVNGCCCGNLVSEFEWQHWCEQCLMGECWDLLVEFVGVSSGKSVGVMVCDNHVVHQQLCG